MEDLIIRSMVEADLPLVRSLFDETMGAGFWGDLDITHPGAYVLAESGGALAGAATGATLMRLRHAPDLPGPVGMVQLVATRPDMREHGIGTALVSAIETRLTEAGAVSLAAFAWVHAGAERGALAGVLGHLGYHIVERLEGFYAGTLGDAPCPACGENPCVCSADLFVR